MFGDIITNTTFAMNKNKIHVVKQWVVNFYYWKVILNQLEELAILMVITFKSVHSKQKPDCKL